MSGYILSADDCSRVYQNVTGTYCNATWDTITCWPKTSSGEVAKQLCPSVFGALPDKYVYRTCESDGNWAKPEYWKGFGFSDYSQCIDHLNMIEDVFEMGKEFGNKSSDTKMTRADSTQAVIAVCFMALSLICLTLLLVLLYIGTAKGTTNRTKYKIMMHTSIACIVDTVVRLVDTSILVFNLHQKRTSSPLDCSPITCKVLITLAEYGYSAVCTWLFIGTHNTQLRAQSGYFCLSGYIVYCFIGWGMPMIPTVIWALTSFLRQDGAHLNDYKYQPIVWILIIPRLLILSSGFVFITFGAIKLRQKTKRAYRSIWFQRMNLECVSYVMYVGYIFIREIISIICNYITPLYKRSIALDMSSSALDSATGMYISVVFFCFNIQLREIFGKKHKRESRRDLVPTCTDEV